MVTCGYHREDQQKRENLRAVAGHSANTLNFIHISQLHQESDQKGEFSKKDNKPKNGIIYAKPSVTKPRSFNSPEMGLRNGILDQSRITQSALVR